MSLLEDQIKRFLTKESRSPGQRRKRFEATRSRRIKAFSASSPNKFRLPEVAETGPPAPLTEPRDSSQKPMKMADYTLERAAFQRCREELLRDHYGKYVVFVGNEMIGFFDSFADAVKEARRKFGRGPIYTKQLVFDDSSR